MIKTAHSALEVLVERGADKEVRIVHSRVDGIIPITKVTPPEVIGVAVFLHGGPRERFYNESLIEIDDFVRDGWECVGIDYAGSAGYGDWLVNRAESDPIGSAVHDVVRILRDIPPSLPVVFVSSSFGATIALKALEAVPVAGVVASAPSCDLLANLDLETDEARKHDQSIFGQATGGVSAGLAQGILRPALTQGSPLIFLLMGSRDETCVTLCNLQYLADCMEAGLDVQCVSIPSGHDLGVCGRDLARGYMLGLRRALTISSVP